jgi:hypothetical protein
MRLLIKYRRIVGFEFKRDHTARALISRSLRFAPFFKREEKKGKKKRESFPKGGSRKLSRFLKENTTRRVEIFFKTRRA